MKTDEGKDRRLFPAQLHPSNTLKYHFYLPSHTLLCYPLSCVSKPFRLSLDHALTSHTDGNIILLTYALSLHLLLQPLSFSMALWNCQSAVNKADFISTFSIQSTLSILGLTETWIRPEDSARAVVKSTFVESKTSPSPKRFESESKEVRVRVKTESKEVRVQVKSKSK